jgi:hypothetical protein
MTTTSQPVARRRRFRFGLRTLLAVVTLAAVGSWAYWFGWPWWQAIREEWRFIENVKKFSPGMSWHDTQQIMHGVRQFSMDEFPDQILEQYLGPNATYYILCHTTKAPDGRLAKCEMIEVFKTPALRSDVINNPESNVEQMREFFLMIGGDRKNNPGFQYELIYSDPPAKPEGK